MNKHWKSILAFCILSCLLSVVVTSVAQAQSEDLIIGLTLPNEGETFYAGPSSMLYSIPIEGWVESGSFDPTKIQVEITIYQGSRLVISHQLFPESNGDYVVYAAVNPGAYSESFAAEFLPCGDVCHFNPIQVLGKEWVASFDLPAGSMLLVVTATDPAGQVASVQRSITVDRSDYALVPVQVVLVDNAQQPVEDIPIMGSTWLYMWRARFATGGTDINGVAHMRVEALAEATTSYRFQVKPSVVNGVFYESITPVDIVLPPGAAVGQPVTLQVRASLGTVHGRVNGDAPLSQMQIWAIHVPDGDTRTIPVSPDGSFTFDDISIDEYLVTTDLDFLASHGFMVAEESIDLSQSISATVNLDLEPLDGYSYQGNVTDIDGKKLPFAWINVEKLNIVEAVMPDTGRYALHGLPSYEVTLMANAPGYYSQARVIDFTSKESTGFDFQLVRRPETRSLSWGDGEIIVPPETRISLSGEHIFLERGWLWGYNHEIDPVIIQSGQTEINLSGGVFALEDVPGQSAWLYFIEGSGTVVTEGESNAIPIQAGQMINLDKDTQLSIVPLDPVVVGAFHSITRLPISAILQPTLMAQLSNRLALFGIDLARLITFITYTLIIVSTILLPLVTIYWWIRQQSAIRAKRKKI